MNELVKTEINSLKPKELRKYFGEYSIIRIIKYILEGQHQHRTDAIRTISFWSDKYVSIDERRILSKVVPYLVDRYSDEGKVNRCAITTALKNLTDFLLILDESILKRISNYTLQENDEKLIKKLNYIIIRSNCNKNNFKKENGYHNPEYYITVGHQTLKNQETIESSEAFQTPLSFKNKQRKIVASKSIQCVYFLQEKDNGYVKIGKTKNLATKTFFPYKMHFEWDVIHIIKSRDIDSLEKYFHRIYRHKCINGEWFNLNQQDIDTIKTFDTKAKEA
ncbi:GIY-YIG nuclease family protein [Priestia aryabhattai]